jgi:hypothetical protein
MVMKVELQVQSKNSDEPSALSKETTDSALSCLPGPPIEKGGKSSSDKNSDSSNPIHSEHHISSIDEPIEASLGSPNCVIQDESVKKSLQESTEIAIFSSLLTEQIEISVEEGKLQEEFNNLLQKHAFLVQKMRCLGDRKKTVLERLRIFASKFDGANNVNQVLTISQHDKLKEPSPLNSSLNVSDSNSLCLVPCEIISSDEGEYPSNEVDTNSIFTSEAAKSDKSQSSDANKIIKKEFHQNVTGVVNPNPTVDCQDTSVADINNSVPVAEEIESEETDDGSENEHTFDYEKIEFKKEKSPVPPVASSRSDSVLIDQITMESRCGTVSQMLLKGEELYVASGTTVMVFDVETKKLIKKFEGHPEDVRCFLLKVMKNTVGTEILVTGCDDAHLRVFEVASMAVIRCIYLGEIVKYV